jgi:hypothetical protein
MWVRHWAARHFPPKVELSAAAIISVSANYPMVDSIAVILSDLVSLFSLLSGPQQQRAVSSLWDHVCNTVANSKRICSAVVNAIPFYAFFDHISIQHPLTVLPIDVINQS